MEELVKPMRTVWEKFKTEILAFDIETSSQTDTLYGKGGTMTDDIKYIEGSGNVFEDLGFDNPEEELAKAKLASVGIILQADNLMNDGITRTTRII
jgi:hypothetical protein